jgi:hypothetical protein
MTTRNAANYLHHHAWISAESGLRRFLFGLVLALGFATFAYANDMDGTWRLVKRKLPDGSVLMPPAVQGLVNISRGMEQTIVFWRTPDGKPASLAQIDRLEVSGSEIAATPILVIFDDGSGKPPLYTVGGERKRAPLSRQAGRITYQHPTHPPFVVLEGDSFTATLDGVFTDYWERQP